MYGSTSFVVDVPLSLCSLMTSNSVPNCRTNLRGIQNSSTTAAESPIHRIEQVCQFEGKSRNAQKHAQKRITDSKNVRGRSARSRSPCCKTWWYRASEAGDRDVGQDSPSRLILSQLFKRLDGFARPVKASESIHELLGFKKVIG